MIAQAETFQKQETMAVHSRYGTYISELLVAECLEDSLLDMACKVSMFTRGLVRENTKVAGGIRDIVETQLTEVDWEEIVVTCLRDGLVQSITELKDGYVKVFAKKETSFGTYLKTFTRRYDEDMKMVFGIPCKYEVIGYWQEGGSNE
ncbi:hypothetical protein [Bacillus thuringiensis]|uniref:hypothetical protein n=1 Tax=Bacillus thuringiensis TaxID=1428 RepID=UPI000BFE4CB6|nr:hypothetical protein [Bacillus thuringiensis]PGT90000.1 hypothetical protein COD17_09630 [Bacillus thuringiensis]